METGGPGGAGVCRAPVGGARSSRCRGEGGEGQRPPESSGRASRGFCAVCLRPPSPRARASLQEARAPRFHRLGNCTTYSTSKLGTGRREGFVKRSSQEGKRPHLPLPGTRGSAPRDLCRGGGNRALACARPWSCVCVCVCVQPRVCMCLSARECTCVPRVCTRTSTRVSVRVCTPVCACTRVKDCSLRVGS